MNNIILDLFKSIKVSNPIQTIQTNMFDDYGDYGEGELDSEYLDSPDENNTDEDMTENKCNIKVDDYEISNSSSPFKYSEEKKYSDIIEDQTIVL